MAFEATDNGLFHVQIESKPFTYAQAAPASASPAGLGYLDNPDTHTGITAVGGYKYAAVPGTTSDVQSWDIAVHEITWNVNPTFIENADELRGMQSMPWHDGAGQMAVEITAKARVRPNMLGLLCYMVAGGNVEDVPGAATPPTHAGDDRFDDPHLTDGTNDLDSNGSDIIAYQHAYHWRGDTEGTSNEYMGENTNLDEPVTASIFFAPTKGDGWKASGCGLTTLAFSFEDSGALVADMVFRGLYFASDTALGITPCYETIKPLTRSNFSFGEGNMSVAESKAVDVNWAIENNITNFFSFGVDSQWPDAIEYEDLWPRVSGSLTKRQVIKEDYDLWIASGADGHFPECIQGIGVDLSTNTDVNTKFAFYMHMPAVQYMAMNPEAITNKRRIGVSFDWEARTEGKLLDCDTAEDELYYGAWCDLYVVNLQPETVYETFPTA
jgi:hypothetical protein